MLKLYYIKGVCSLVPHIALEWAKVDYQLQEVSRTDVKEPAYLALNPLGAVPLLQDGDWALSQNIAILDYLHELYPQAKIFGAGDIKAQAKARQWLAFANSDLHKTFGGLFKPATFVKDEAAQSQVREMAAEKVKALYAIADNVLANQDYLTGELTIADVYLYVTLRWAKGLQLDLSHCKSLEAFYQRVESNAGVQAALKQQGL